MKVLHLIYTLSAAIVILLNSCAPAYVPNVINTPLFSNKGEIQVSVHSGTSGVDPQFAYALMDNVGLMINGSFANRTSDTTDNYHKHKFIEIGPGYYDKIGTNGRYEVYGGVGYGELQANYENGLWPARTNVTCIRFFLQPAIGVTTDVFDGSFATRLVLLDLRQESERNTGFFLEPVFTCKVGYRYVKGVFQFGLSFPFNSNTVDFTHQPLVFSVGLQADLCKIYED